MECSLSQEKAMARKMAGKARLRAHKNLKDSAGDLLAGYGLEFLGDMTDKHVSGFYPYLSEISTLELLASLSSDGWTTCLPVVIGDNQPLVFRKWQCGDESDAGRWGILEPKPSAKVIEPNVLLVPLLAFDRKGFRLGYGGGFYDRSIEQLAALKAITVIGVGYSAQQVDRVPVEEHDQKLDWILTEKGPIKCE